MARSENNKKNTLRTLHYFWWGIKRYKWQNLAAVLLTIIVILVRSIICTLILANMLEEVEQGLPANEIMPTLIGQAIALIVTYAIGSSFFGELRTYFNWHAELLTMYDLSNLTFDTISAQSMQFHTDRFSGSLVSQSNKFVGAYERFMDVIIWELLPFLTSVISILIILFTKIPAFALGMLIFIAIYVAISALSFKKIANLNAKEASAGNKVTGQLADSISNIASVKSYAKEKHERERFARFNRIWLSASNDMLRGNLVRNIKFDFVYISMHILRISFLIWGGVYSNLSLSTLLLIITYSGTIMDYLWDVNNIFKSMNRVFGDAYEMTEILDMDDDVVDLEDAKPLKIQKGAVKFDHITFKHSDAKETIFEDFELSIKPGERIGLVGISGSGKTTLTKLLLRFADVQQGKITIDNQDIKHATQQSLREAIAYVPQETALFHRSISENIAYGKPNASQQEIERAAKLANAHDFIKNLPDGYETLVGERGIKLSGGQRQRIAIARAILKDAPILVLDEATSALDSESEALIQDALNKLMKGRTSLVIAHRLSTVANLDRIIVLEDGKIVEQGAHQELLKTSSGAYHKLWSRQSGTFLEEK